MLRLSAFAFILVLAAAQDPADKVKALLAKLGSEELLERDEAAAQLAKLGPAAIPAIRSHIPKASDSVGAILKKVVWRIERDERVASLSRPGPRVTLSVREYPVAELLADIAKQTEVPILARRIPAEARITIEFRERPVAAAIDDVCRSNGGLAATWSPTDVIIEPGTPRALPTFDHGPFRFHFDRIEFKFQDIKKTRTSAMLRGGLIGPRGAFPDQVWLDVDSAEDDKGTDLGKQTGPGTSVFTSNSGMSFPLVPEKDRIFDYLWWHARPAPEATKVKLKGAVRMVFAVDFRSQAGIKDPTGAPTSKSAGGMTTLEILSWVRREAVLSFTYRMTQAAPSPSWKSGSLERPRQIALEDRQGRRLMGRCLQEMATHRIGVGDPRWEIDGVTEFTIPDGFDYATLDLLEPAETRELNIPFELNEVPLSR